MKSFALVFLLALLWGGAYPLLKVAVETIPPLTVAGFRSLLAALFLLAVLGPRARAIFAMLRGRESRRALLVQAAFNSFIPLVLVAWALTHLDASLVTILNSLSPIFIVVITAGITRQEVVTGRKATGVVLGLAGVVTIVGLDALMSFGTKTLAELACIAGSLCYAIGGVTGVRMAKGSPLVPAAGIALVSAAVMIPLALVVEQPWNASPSAASLAATAAIALLSSGVGMVLYFHLLGSVGAVGVSAQAYLRILVGVAIGIAFLGERPTASLWLGLGLVVTGVIAMTRR